MPSSGRPHLKLRSRPLGVLLLLAGVSGVTALPQRQPLEGTLEATAISFSVPPSVQAEGIPFLGLALRSLCLSSLGGGEPLRVVIGGKTLDLVEGDSLTLSASMPRPGPGQVLFVEVWLPAGALVRHLQADGSGERILKFDLHPPPGNGNQPPVFLRITPAQPLRAQLSQLEAVAPPVPTSVFSPVIKGAAQLRLTPMEPGRAVAFEPALTVHDLRLTTEILSPLSNSPLLRSSLRGGELHLGRSEPLKLRSDQFLTILPPGVSELTDLQLQSKGGMFSLAVVGESTGLESGLSRKYRTTVVHGTILSRFFSPEQIASFYGFLAGMASSVLLQLFKMD